MELKSIQLKIFACICLPFKHQAALSIKAMNSYSAAADVAEDIFSGIRTVFALGGEKVKIERYNKRLVTFFSLRSSLQLDGGK